MATTATPNIVMIIADQMAFDVIGALGHPAVKTPHMDQLVRHGVAFTNGYCNSPLCVPSRASMLSGKLPSHIEVYDNGSEFRASIPTFVHHLRRGGYETTLSGKMHFIGPDQLHGFEQRLTQDLQPMVVPNVKTKNQQKQEPMHLAWRNALLAARRCVASP